MTAKVTSINKESITQLKEYVLYLADNSMILGQRLGEWCGHGPILEQDIAMTNIALDLIGEARSLYQYIAELDGNGATEDDYPYKRDVLLWRNLLLVEQPNEDFAYTIVRQFLFDVIHYHQLQQLLHSKDERLSAIAHKSIKEARYHLKYSSEWMVRLGDGTEISHKKMQTALDARYPYFAEAFVATESEQAMIDAQVAPDCQELLPAASSMVQEVVERATLTLPEVPWPQRGGKTGTHSEHLGFILSDLQFLQKTYPNSQW